MNILVTGANGFVGRALVNRLLAQGAVGPGEARFTRLTTVDLALDGLPDDSRARARQHRRCRSPRRGAGPRRGSGLSSRQHSRRRGREGLRVGSAGEPRRHTVRLLELLRAQCRAPRLVFTSTIAVFGTPMPARIDDATPLRPALSYGAHKLVGEVLMQDYSRP